MPSFNQLEKGSRIIIDGQPYEIIEASHVFKGRGQSLLQAKIKNLKTGNIVSRSFRPSETFKEAEIGKMRAEFLYQNKNSYFFCEKDNPRNRFSLTYDQIGPKVKFLKEKEIVEAIIFNDEIINISLPIKITFKVTEAPPGVKGDRSQSGTKVVKLETGTQISVPLFIKEGDLVEINTEDEKYVKRV